MLITKRRIIKGINSNGDLILLKCSLRDLAAYHLLNKREVKLAIWVKGLVYDSKQNAILNYSDLSIVKRL